MIEVRWHGRGGQGAKSMSQVLAEAWLGQGEFTQAFPEYGPERSGAPVTAYTRADHKPIRIHHAVRNPDWVVVLDPSLIGEIPLTAGLEPDGWVVVNSPEPAQSVADKLQGAGRVLRVNGNQLAQSVGSKYANTVMLGVLAGAMGQPSLAHLQEAFQSVFSGLSPAALETNLRALEAGYQTQPEEARSLAVGATSQPTPLRTDLPGGVVVAETAPHPRTGGWRTGQKPAVNLQACVNCLLCWVYCPDAAILTENKVFTGFDYDYCKGCELCVKACPTGAIEMVPETYPVVGKGEIGGSHA